MITIIVLLILAGVTIAMLTGENGILSRAQETRGTSAYAQACEQARLAYMTVKTEIMTQKVSNSSYKATDNAGKLAKKVRAELTGNGTWEVTPAEESATGNKITITYTNSSLRAGMVGENKPAQSGSILFEIGLLEQDATLSIDGVQVSGGSQTGGLTGVDFGEKTATTIAQGEDLTITIGSTTESFRVLSTDNSTTIVAVPFYNITLDTSNPVQTTTYNSTTKTKFSAEPYWIRGTDTIDMTDSRNNIQQYITAYSNKLYTATNGKVTARVARYSEMSASGVKNAIRNPGQIGDFWLGSGYPAGADYVCLVGSNR